MTETWTRRYVRPVLRILFNIFDIFIHWLYGLIYGGVGDIVPPITNLYLLESATSLARKIRTRKTTSVEVLEAFIERIRQVNGVLNCVVAERFAEALDEARIADKLVEAGDQRPLLGVPFTTKDCIAVKGLIHTAGLVKRKNIIAEEDAEVVRLLREAGAIPIALTNVSELCMWWESANVIHGRTNNPYNTNHIVGGSSGGEGCVQAAAGSAFGIGSDIGGSIRMPAFFNGIFGHKPSQFIVSNVGQFPSPFTQDQHSFLGLGPMCRHAEDLIPLLKVIAGKNAQQLRLDDGVDVKKLRFFYQDNDCGGFFVSNVDKEIRGLFVKIGVHLLKAHGIRPQKVCLERFAKSTPMWLANMKSPNGPSFQEQLTNLEGSINPPMELLKWCLRLSNHTFIGIATSMADRGGCRYGDDKHQYLVEEKNRLRRELQDLLGDDGVFIYPTHPTPAPYHNEPILKPFNFSYTAVINVLGFPATHIPMGLNRDGIPIGVQVIANDKNDRLCLAVAREFEKAFGGWMPPGINV